MNNISVDDLLRIRMRSLGISAAAPAAAGGAAINENVVRHLGAVQAQDYLGAKWSLGVRLPETTDDDVEAAIANREIVRTWALRGTLHLLPAKDVRWILDLVAPRVIPNLAGACRRLDLTEDVIARSQAVIVECLAGGRALTRLEVFAALERGGIPLWENRGSHILYRAALDQAICNASRQGKEFTFALLDEWVPSHQPLDADSALAELTRRYFTSHGPATVRDFAWWSGLTLGTVRAGIAMISSELTEVTSEGQSYWMSSRVDVGCAPCHEAFLLPGFDEFMLGYRYREAAVPEKFQDSLRPVNGMFSPIVVIDGHVVGTWRRTVQANGVKVEITPFAAFSKGQDDAINVAVERYCTFLGQGLKE